MTFPLTTVLLLGLSLLPAAVRAEESSESRSTLTPLAVNFNPGPEYADEVRMFQGIPSVEVASNGRLWATWYGGGTGEGPENYIMLNTSADGGETWSELKLVIDPPHRASEPALWHDPQGKLWLMWNEYPHGLRGADSRMWAMTTEQSDRADPAWSEPRLIARELNNFNKPTVLRDGRWLWPAGSWNFANLSRPLFSSDHGRTFTPGGEIPIARKARNFEEYQVVERAEGTLWLLTRTSYGIGESFSEDGGATWTEVKPSALTHTVSRFFVSRLASGKLLLVKNGPIDEDVGRSRMMAFLSDDDGATWSGGLMLDERGRVSYPDGVQAADGTIHVIYDHERHAEKEILLAVFTEGDVAAGKTVSDKARLRLVVNKATGLNSRHQTPTAHDFLRGDRAELELPDVAAMKVVEKGAVLFSDRTYRWHQIPEPFQEKRYVQMSIDGGEARVTRGGVVYVATPLPARNRDSVQGALLNQGFVLSKLDEFSLFEHANANATLCSVFQKQVETGETVRIGKWGIVVY